MTKVTDDHADSHRPTMSIRPRLQAQLPAFALVALASALIWWACVTQLPSFSEVQTEAGRFMLAVKCISLCGLFTLMAAIEAVAHERLVTPAFDPLAGAESRRLRINLRFLQNTLEQFSLFAVALCGLALYLRADQYGAVIAASVVFVLTRYVFWIGYHLSSANRLPGLVGHGQTMLILLYVAGRIGFELAGLIGATSMVGFFGLIEIGIAFSLRNRAE